MKRVGVLAAMLAGFCHISLAQPNTKAAEAKPTVLGAIDSEVTEKSAFITIRLGEGVEPAPVKMEDHNSFLQLRIPDTVVPESGKFIETQVKQIPKLAVFQITRNDAAVRLFTEGETKLVRDVLKIDHLGNRIVVSLDAEALKAIEAKKMAESIVATTEVRTDIPPPAEALKGSASASAIGEDSFLYGDKVRIIVIFLGVLCAGLGILLLLRPFLRRHIKQMEVEQGVCMKTISSMQLAARQKLSLVQVGDQKLLIGVTPENISFLTSIDDKKAPTTRDVQAPAVAGKYLEMMRKRPLSDLMDKGAVVREAKSDFDKPVSAPMKPKVEAKPKVAAQKPAALEPAELIDEGPATKVQLSSRSKPKQLEPDTESAIADVTQMIREKIKSLPKI